MNASLLHSHPPRGTVVWLTGLSGSGKTTLAAALERALSIKGVPARVLDGDVLRRGPNRDLGFSAADRRENIRRVAEMAVALSSAGQVAIAALISPMAADRQRAREIAEAAGQRFVEIYLAAPLAVCEVRDEKGLYRKARAGEIADFTGISAPYEPPPRADLTVRSDTEELGASVARVLEVLRPHFAG